jgi:hypothetical protein
MHKDLAESTMPYVGFTVIGCSDMYFAWLHPKH